MRPLIEICLILAVNSMTGGLLGTTILTLCPVLLSMKTKTLTVDDEDLDDEDELEPPLVDEELPPLEVLFEVELDPPPPSADPSSLRASKSASVGGPSRTITCSALDPTVFEAAAIYACIVVNATFVVKFA
jgi:hypothetical protein